MTFMRETDIENATKIGLENAVAAQATRNFVLRLYVNGATPHSARAIVNIRKFCEEHLRGRYQLEVVDILQHPHLAEKEQVIATPTLVKKSPLPVRRFVGDMGRTERILRGMEIVPLMEE